MIGSHVQGTIAGANLAVTGNSATATATANDASNQLAVSGGNLALSSQIVGPLPFSAYDAPLPATADFNLANGQFAHGDAVKATTRDVRIAVEARGGRNDGNWIGGSTLAVSGNTIAAEARANNASNQAALTGFNTLATRAAVNNQQQGETGVAARVDAAQLRIRAIDASIEGSQLVLSDNTVQAIGVGSSASNSLAAQATELGGAQVPMIGIASFEGMPGPSGGFAVNNLQSQYGNVSAQTQGSVRMNLEGSGLAGGAATVSGNTVAAVAQATSAANALNLAGTNVGELAGTVSSNQSTYADVSAQQTAQRSAGATFVVQAGAAFGAPLTVSNNGVLASAGQNEAFNDASVAGTNVGGTYAVLNGQQGNGSVTARAEPLMVGVQAGAAYVGSVAVSGNTVAAKAAFNTASNALSIGATSGVGASGTIANQQSTSAGSFGAASVGAAEGEGAMVGVSQGLYGMGAALNGTTATISGNTLAADAAGNTASNALSVTGAIAGSGSVYGPAYTVLNSQTNQAALNATVTGSGLGLSAYGAALAGTAAAVTGNLLQATATGNSASNALALGAATGGFGQGAAVNNVQFNNASINAAVRGAMVGVGAGSVGGGSTVITGNSIAAQAIGNSAVNKLGVK
jgi:hypothetical protein